MKKRTHNTWAVKDGNAFAILEYVAQCMRHKGKSKKDVDLYFKRAKSSDYPHLLYVSQLELKKLKN